jgi:hypothetical protein
MENKKRLYGDFTEEYIGDSIRNNIWKSYISMFFDPEAESNGMSIIEELGHDFSALEQDKDPQKRQYESPIEAALFA